MSDHRLRDRRTIRTPSRRPAGSAVRPLEVLESRQLLALYVVTNTSDGGPGSLRDAINTINADSIGPNEIDFAIPGNGVQTIAPASPLPAIGQPVRIDGYTQPNSSPNSLNTGDNATILIQLSGQNAGGEADGLTLSAPGSTIRGLAINRFSGSGLHLLAGGQTVVGNFIGTDATGANPLANAGDGILIDGTANNSIGSPDVADRNLISGNGGLFAPASTFASGPGPVQVASSDFNFDGNGDLAVVDTGDNSLRIFLGQADGTFTAGQVIPLGATPTDVSTVGFSGDLVVTLFDGQTQTGSVVLLRSNSDGTFQPPTTISQTPGEKPVAVAGGSFTQDFNSDFAVLYGQLGSSPGVVRAFLESNTTPGTYQPPVLLTPGTDPTDIAIGGIASAFGPYDIAVTNRGDNTVSVFLTNGDGTFKAPTTLAVGTAPVAVAIADLTNDGKGDIAVANSGSGDVSLLIQTATGTFNPARNIATGNTPSGVAIGTFQDSSFPGIAVTDAGSNDVAVIGRGGTGSIRPTVHFSTGSNPLGVAAFRTSITRPGSSRRLQGLAVINGGDSTVSTFLPNVTTGAGVHALGASASGNVISGNIIGLNAAGTTVVPNAQDGVFLDGAPNNTVGGGASLSGNVISGNNGNGVQIAGANASGNLVAGNLIGTAATGTGAITLGNAQAGVAVVTAPSNVIANNVISGNQNNGVVIKGTVVFNSGTGTSTYTDAPNNVIRGNTIGLDSAGTARIQNFGYGILIDAATGATIGGTSPNSGNIVSGSTNLGIEIRSGNSIGGSTSVPVGATDIVIQGNRIGTNAAGTAAIANVQEGIELKSAARITIGGTSSAARNIISGNGDDGIGIRTSSIVGVVGNYIGTDVNGMAAIPNGTSPTPANNVGAGIFVADSPNVTIGGPNPGEGNLISGNSVRGILISRPKTIGTVVQGNLIGTDATGTGPLGNTKEGIVIHNGATNSIIGIPIGSSLTSGGNTIAFNGTVGVAVELGDIPSDGPSTGNQILGNAIFSNGGLGIDLGNDGVTPNDTKDPDTGSNNFQNFPSITAANVSGGAVTISSTVNSTPNATLVLEFYASASADPSGSGEGQQPIGRTTVTTDNSGNATFTASFAPPSLIGLVFSATATDATTFDTSEFSTVFVLGPSFVVTNTNDSGPGSLRQVLTDANATPGVQTITFLIPGSGVQTIAPATPLPDIVDPVVIDAYTQPGASPNSLGLGDNAVILVQLLGVTDTSVTDGLVIGLHGGGSTIRGLAIGGFNAPGSAGIAILDSGATANQIEGNFLGTDASGLVAVPNNYGVRILTAGNLVGGAATAQRNIISGNTSGGILLDNSGATANTIVNNYIGTNATGLAALPNGGNGISAFSAPGNTIGGASVGLPNVISGNSGFGVGISGSLAGGNVLQGNFIGLGADGMTAVGNALGGVGVDQFAPNNLIGGTLTGAANIISGNLGDGVLLGGGSSATSVYGNRIGTTFDGLAARPNGDAKNQTGVGVHVLNSASNTIGGTALGFNNLISANVRNQVVIEGAASQFNRLIGNVIGPDSSGLVALSSISGSGVVIGEVDGPGTGATDTLVAQNVISGNGPSDFGVLISGGSTTRNILQGNYIGLDGTLNGALPNGYGIGVTGGAGGNLIGGTVSGTANFLSGNVNANVYFGSSGPNAVFGNLIGLNTSGSAALNPASATTAGVFLDNGSTGVSIGGTAPGTGNFISGNAGVGVLIQGRSDSISALTSGILVAGNRIGTDLNGSVAVPNGNIGVEVSAGAHDNTIGGGNLISGNAQDGIFLDASSSNLVAGNVVGLAADGKTALGNGSGRASLIPSGIALQSGSSNNTIGGTTASARNVVSGNLGNAISLYGSPTPLVGNLIEGNYLGTDTTGGVAVGNGGQGVFLQADQNTTIGGPTAGSGNVISGNRLSGIQVVQGSTGTLIQGNLIGTDASAGKALPNGAGGLWLNSSGTTVGGTASLARNVISGNTGAGVSLSGEAATGNLILGNVIGTDYNGLAAVPNTGDGIRADTGASANTIGGTASGAGNVISGNRLNGINLNSVSGFAILGNLMGTDSTGRVGIGNSQGGVVVGGGSTAVTIGGTDAGSRNVVSGNSGDGLTLQGGSTDVVVLGNDIGVGSDGTTPLGNGGNGINADSIVGPSLSFGAVIGSAQPGGRNVISGNGGNGILAGASLLLIEANWLGVNASGGALGNGGSGILFRNDLGSLVGGPPTTITPGNVIAFNGGNGITETGAPAAQIRANSIYANGKLGIDLGNDGVTPNHPPTSPTDPNRFPNYPVLAAVSTSGTTLHITGTFDGTIKSQTTIDFFASPAADPSGFGEGQLYLGSITVNTDGNGHAIIAADLPASMFASGVITATATSFATSEFSRAITFGVAPVPDLKFTLAASADPAPVATTLAYTITLANVGQGDAASVTVTDILPALVMLTDASAQSVLGQGGTVVRDDTGVTTVTLPIGTLAAGATRTLVLQTTVLSAGTAVDTVRASLVANDQTVSSQVSLTTRTIFTFQVFTNADSGFGSLRQAILNANANPGPDTITFNLPTDQLLIQPAAPLPFLFDAGTTVDGTTQPGFAGSPIVELNGSGIAPKPDFTYGGLTLIGGGATIRGLTLDKWDKYGIILAGGAGSRIAGVNALGNGDTGIFLQGSSDNTVGGTTAADRVVASSNGSVGLQVLAGSARNVVIGSFFGTDSTGTKALANVQDGIFIADSPNNTIGGLGAGDANVISANGEANVQIFGEGATGNVIAGNFIGTDITGQTGFLHIATAGRGETNVGVFINGAPGNAVGGTDPQARNVISSVGAAVEIFGPTARGNLVARNFLGTNSTGQKPLANSIGAFVNNAPGNSIGGAGIGNLISGNGVGVRIDGPQASNNLVSGNIIGLESTAHKPLGNTLDGVFVVDAPGNTIGGTASGAGNVISGNGPSGIQVFGVKASGNLIAGNLIGPTPFGGVFGNTKDGVFLNDAPNTTVGGVVAGAGNVVEGNGSIGIQVFGPNATGEMILGNTVRNNGSIGISVENAGVNTAPTSGLGANAVAGNPIGVQFTPNPGPAITGLSAQGDGATYRQVVIQFSESLNPARAMDRRAYRINLLNNRGRTTSGVGIASISYDDATRTVTITLASAVPASRGYHITILGRGKRAVTDLKGNPLDGAGTGGQGTNFDFNFGTLPVKRSAIAARRVHFRAAGHARPMHRARR